MLLTCGILVFGLREQAVMKIKQQRSIKKFLETEYPSLKAEEIFNRQSSLLTSMIKSVKDEDGSRFKTLEQTILPRIALYKVLEEYAGDEERIKIMRRYMLDVVASKKHASTARMEVVPGFFYIYRAVFLKIMKTTTLQESTQVKGKGYYDITITKCLWHEACVRFECPELCPLFCDVDDVTYGGLRKIGFSRTKTLGYDGDCCDFHFYQKRE